MYDHRCHNCERSFMSSTALISHSNFCTTFNRRKSGSEDLISSKFRNSTPEKKIGIQIRKDYQKDCLNNSPSKITSYFAPSETSNSAAEIKLIHSRFSSTDINNDKINKLIPLMSKKLTCKPCNKTYQSYKSLRCHITQHAQWTRYVCSMCQFRTFYRSKCYNHCVGVHGANNTNILEFLLEEEKIGPLKYYMSNEDEETTESDKPWSFYLDKKESPVNSPTKKTPIKLTVKKDDNSTVKSSMNAKKSGKGLQINDICKKIAERRSSRNTEEEEIETSDKSPKVEESLECFPLENKNDIKATSIDEITSSSNSLKVGEDDDRPCQKSTITSSTSLSSHSNDYNHENDKSPLLSSRNNSFTLNGIETLDSETDEISPEILKSPELDDTKSNSPLKSNIINGFVKIKSEHIVNDNCTEERNFIKDPSNDHNDRLIDIDTSKNSILINSHLDVEKKLFDLNANGNSVLEKLSDKDICSKEEVVDRNDEKITSENLIVQNNCLVKSDDSSIDGCSSKKRLRPIESDESFKKAKFDDSEKSAQEAEEFVGFNETEQTTFINRHKSLMNGKPKAATTSYKKPESNHSSSLINKEQLKKKSIMLAMQNAYKSSK